MSRAVMPVCKSVFQFVLMCIFILLFLCFSAVSCTINQGRNDVEVVSDFENARELALQAAKRHPKIDFEPYEVTDAGFNQDHVPEEHFLHEDFTDYFFVYVWSELAHKENSPFAISKEGNVFKLPEEFNKLVRDRELSLENENEGLVLLQFYMVFDTILPGMDKHLILDSIDDVPGIIDQQGVINKYQELIRPVKITEQEEGWIYDLFTWQFVNGKLIHWEVTVNQYSGEIDIQEKNIISSQVGDYVQVE